MGDILRRRFAAGWKRVGAFTLVYPPNGVPTKSGGNVAAYFCTPDLRVLSAVVGPASADDFLREAEKAVELARDTFDGLSEDAGSRAEALQAGRGNPWSAGWREWRAYQALAARPLSPLGLVYREVFEALGEQVSEAPVRVEGALMPYSFRRMIEK